MEREEFGLRHFKLEPFTVHFSGDELKWKPTTKNQERCLLMNTYLASTIAVNYCLSRGSAALHTKIL